MLTRNHNKGIARPKAITRSPADGVEIYRSMIGNHEARHDQSSHEHPEPQLPQRGELARQLAIREGSAAARAGGGDDPGRGVDGAEDAESSTSCNAEDADGQGGDPQLDAPESDEHVLDGDGNGEPTVYAWQKSDPTPPNPASLQVMAIVGSIHLDLAARSMLKFFALTALLAVLVPAAFVDPKEACRSSGVGCAMDCSPDSKDGLQAKCWEFLDMGGYINDWVKTEGDSAGIKQKGFAQAYLAWSGRNGDTCNLITSDTCEKPETDPKLYKDPQQFYLLWNIFSVWQYHTQFISALTASQSVAATKLGQIVDKVNPQVEANVGSPQWFATLTTTLSYVSLATGIATTGAPALVGGAAWTIVNGLWAARATPPMGIPKKAYTETAQTRFTRLADVGADLSDLINAYKDQLTLEVRTMQDNAESFIALCSFGGFSQRIEMSLTDQSNNLYKALELFVLSKSLSASGVVIAKSPGIDPRQVATETGEISCPGFGPAGNCYTWWYGNGNTYAFHDINNDQRDFTDLINYIWDQKIVADMGEIFAQEACSGKTISLSDNPDPKSHCASSVKICEYGKPRHQYTHCQKEPSLTQSPAAYDTHIPDQQKKEFNNCDNDPKWMRNCKKKAGDTFVLPLSYLGPLLHKGNYCRKP
ncbi:Glycoside hydrolase [Teratosphaeria destructans]|uniref:Glycoside hydrolase n=1 Tax=Teratosphaeria destructans TaxID=418781 RepID=A0A9W7W5G3_9PEZI|nr:Glycoside hydrolase [Teratosphaeria destructans]